MEEHFTKLGLEPGAGLEDIKKAFREKIKLCHPDRSSGEAEEARLLIEAYNYLKENHESYSQLKKDSQAQHQHSDLRSGQESVYDYGRGAGERIYREVFKERTPFERRSRPPVEDVYDPLVFLKKRSESVLPLDKGEMMLYRAEMALRDVVAQYNRQKKHRSKKAWSREYTGKLVNVQVLFRDITIRYPGLSVQARMRLRQIDELIGEIKQMV